ncbi:MAG: hypothetical protein ACD_9C00124G0002 [uncultured bacterium]|nr:MAG: hypothetical protein ACD_9C00124G0002 [uncultured bacterium]
MRMMNKENAQKILKEWPGLNFVKFVCVAVMVFVHSHLILITDRSYSIADTSGFFYGITSKTMFVGLFLFILPIIAGAIFRMDLGARIVNGRLIDYSFKKVVRIAIFLTLAGFFMNFLTANIKYLFSWNILQLMALSLIIVVALLKFISIRAVFLLGLVTLIAAESLRNFLSDSHFYFINILIGGDKGFIFWPFFPWFSVIVFGFLFAHLYLKYEDNIKFRIGALVAGVAFLAIAAFRGEISPYLDPEYVWGASLFQPKIGLVLASMGLFSVLVVVANYVFSNVQLKKYGIVNSYSKGILWIYVIQMFANYKLAALVKRFFPIDGPSVAYFILPVSMLLLSWLIGAATIKLLQEKLIVVRFKKLDEKSLL